MNNLKKNLKWINKENLPYVIKVLRKAQKKSISKTNGKKLNRILTEFYDEFVCRLEKKVKDLGQISNFKEEENVINILRKEGLYAAHDELMTLKILEHNKQLKKEKLKKIMNADFYMKYF